MFLENLDTLILSGCPGIGKSTWVERHFKPDLIRVVSANHFFEWGGKYKFDPSKLKQAHGSCLQEFAYLGSLAQSSGSRRQIIVDNTNTSLLEIAPYYALSEAYGRRTGVIVFEPGPHFGTLEEAAARNIHGVPRDKVFQMAERAAEMTRKAPPFWDLYMPDGAPITPFRAW